MDFPPIRVDLDGDGLLDYIGDNSGFVLPTEDSFVVTADIRTIMDGVLVNLQVVIGED